MKLRLAYVFIFALLSSGLCTGCRSTSPEKKVKQESPEMQLANSEADKFVKARFRKYGEKSSFIKFNLKDWQGSNYHKGTIVWELTNLKWSVKEMRLDQADKDNGLEWVGQVTLDFDTDRRFILFSPDNERGYVSGRTEYEKSDIANAHIMMIKRKGQRLKIDDESEALQNWRWSGRHFRNGTMPSIDEIKRMQSLPFNKELQLYSTFFNAPYSWLRPE